MPIGLDEGGVRLLTVMDSGGALNLGDLAYHQSLADVYPEVVYEFKSWEEVSSLERLKIYGVSKENETAVEISHVVRYHTPYRYQGQPVLISYALSPTASCTALLGITFHTEANAVGYFGGESKRYYIGKFDDEFPTEFHRPSLRKPPTHRVAPGLPTTLVAKPGTEGVIFTIGEFSE
jgi:hypothetical protein